MTAAIIQMKVCSQHRPNAGLLLGSVEDGGSTLNQHWKKKVKLESFGFSCNFLKWIKIFLHDQYIIGPLLFVVYIDDICLFVIMKYII